MQETAASERIQLQIGESTFSTTKATIAESLVLSTLVSLPPPEEGPYFIDADPALFQHVLRYLRTGMFPIFYDPDKGHDECLYLALLNQALFYQIDRLRDWIAGKSYLDAVTRHTYARSITLYGEDQIGHLDELTHYKNETLRIINVTQSRSKCFRCPKRNWKHDGHRQLCIHDRCLTSLTTENMKKTHDVEMRVLKIDYVVTAVKVSTEISTGRALPAADDGTSLPPPYDH